MDHLVYFLPSAAVLGATGGLTLAEARRTSSWTLKKEQQIVLKKELTKTLLGHVTN